MIPNNPTSVRTVGTTTPGTKLSIDQTATAHIMGLLTNLYSDPVLAVVREYSTNALDSHIVADNEDPIRVTLPTSFNPTLTIQDFGIGLSIDDLTETYALYGASTKRESDLVNGVLGLGCKSALTYTDSFTVTAVKNGVKVYAVIAKDEDGVGDLRIIDTVAVDEANGVTIGIPVKVGDIDTFARKAATFFSFWEVGSVLVDGAAPVSVHDDANWLWLSEDVAVKSSGDSYVVMAGVAYRANIAGNIAILAYVPTGSVNFTPSREALHYTKRTEDTLAELKSYVKDRTPQVLTTALETITNPYQRLQFIAHWKNYSGNLGRIAGRALAGEHGYGPKAPSGRVVWEWEGGYTRGTRKQTHQNSWFDLLGTKTIVTNYPLRSLTEASRERLKQFGVKSAWIYPSGMNWGVIEGRENVVDWDDIVAATYVEKVKVERGTRQAQTVYTVYHGSQIHAFTAKEITAEVGGDVLLFTYANTNPASTARCVPEAWVVEIKSTSSAEKFKRLFPGARYLADYHQERLAAAKAALTNDDYRFVSIPENHFIRVLVGRADIVDPEIQALATLIEQGSERVEEVRRLGGSTSLSYEQKNTAATANDKLVARYPLLKGIPTWNLDGDEITFYINAKYYQARALAKSAKVVNTTSTPSTTVEV